MGSVENRAVYSTVALLGILFEPFQYLYDMCESQYVEINRL